MNYIITTLGLAFLGLASAIVFKQRSATKCEKHDPLAGKVAMVLAFICGGTGIAMLIFAAMNAGGLTSKSKLSVIVFGKGADKHPAQWKLLESDQFSYKLAISSEVIWDEHILICPRPLTTKNRCDWWSRPARTFSQRMPMEKLPRFGSVVTNDPLPTELFAEVKEMQ